MNLFKFPNLLNIERFIIIRIKKKRRAGREPVLMQGGPKFSARVEKTGRAIPTRILRMFMFVCVCVCMCVCLFICVCVFFCSVFICLYLCVCVYVFCVSKSSCVLVCICFCVWVNVCVCVFVVFVFCVFV